MLAAVLMLFGASLATQDEAGDLLGGDAGRVYVLSGRFDAVPLALEGRPGEEFGAAVADAGDCNGDGAPDLVVGAPQRSSEGRGSVALFCGRTGRRLLRIDGREGDRMFGFAVAGRRTVSSGGATRPARPASARRSRRCTTTRRSSCASR